MFRRPPRSTLFPLHDALPISGEQGGAIVRFLSNAAGEAPELPVEVDKLVDYSLNGRGPLAVSSMAQWSGIRSEEHTSELQSHVNLVCRLLLEKKKKKKNKTIK